MNLRAIAILQAATAPERYQRTAVHVTLGIQELPGKVRFDLAVMGDIRAAGGPDWQPGTTETGPNYHTSGELGGKLEGAERLAVSFIEEVRATLSLRMRRIATTQTSGSTLLKFIANQAETVATYPFEPPSGYLADSFITQIGSELRGFVLIDLQASLVSAVLESAPGEPQRIKLSDQKAMDLWRGGVLPLNPDQAARLHQRLGLPVPKSAA